MARTYKHFKVHVSVLNHRKMIEVVRDDRLFSLWVKLGVLAIETWAARHGDEFFVSDSQLVTLTNKRRPDSAYRIMRKLIDASPLVAQYRDRSGEVSDEYCNGIWQVQFTNLLEKQGFHSKNSETTALPYKARKLSGFNKKSEPTPDVLSNVMKMFIN